MPYDRILDLMSAPDHPGLFFLGTYARRVTVYSQQVRAVNLVDAIHFYRQPLKGTRLAVVGAGAAGLTAAARGLSYGAQVTLLEQNEQLLSLQQNSSHRWLHPTIYDWPTVDIALAQNDVAGLPVMNWTAQDANSFASDLTEQWREVAAKAGTNIRAILPAKVTAITPMSEGYEVSFVDNRGKPPENRVEQFPLVVLAVGFGLEPEGKGRNSYWEKDSWDQTIRPDRAVLIAGYGDGALTDLMRICLVGFNHQELLARVARAVTGADLARVMEIEADARAADAQFLSAAYRQLRMQPVIDALQPFVVKNRRVVLTGRGEHLFDPRASALNRLVASQLLQYRAFEHRPLLDGEEIKSADTTDPVVSRIQREAGFDFTDIVLRFGPDPSIRKIAGLPASIAQLEARWARTQPESDPTRSVLWKSFTPIAETLEDRCITIHPNDTTAEQNSLRIFMNNVVGELKKARAISVTSVTVAAATCVKSHDALIHTVRALCRAPIVVFVLGKRMGQDNPAGMLLLGIRAAVRRGLTLVLHEERIEPPDWSLLPFNLKDLQVLSIERTGADAQRLAESIASGLAILGSDASGYRDLPAFEIVRRPSRRTLPPESGKMEAFVLCPFSENYTNETWQNLKLILQNYEVIGGALEIRRVVDYSSPILVGERLYELIRFAGICIADWTEWRANVFFEMGVRLAVHPRGLICVLLDTDSRDLDGTKSALMHEFSPIVYSLEQDRYLQEKLSTEIEGAGLRSRSTDSVYAAAQRNLFSEQEYGRNSFHEEILRQVKSIVGRDIIAAGTLPVLYNRNRTLAVQVWRGSIEALSAARLLVRQHIRLATLAAERDEHRAVQKEIESLLLELLKLNLDASYQAYGKGIRADRKTDLGSVLRKVHELKRNSRQLRDEQKFEEAGEALSEAIRLLEREKNWRDSLSDSGDDALPVPQDMHETATQLADCYGSLGGIYRRRGMLREALAQYAHGKELERTDSYRISNSYNLTQWLVVQLLEPDLMQRGVEYFWSELRSAIDVIRRQIATVRSEDAWAYSDLGLLYILSGDEAAARMAWDDMDDLEPIPSVYTSGLAVLEELSKTLPQNDAMQRAIERFAAAG
ncbi:MAG: hypothetical protein WAS21_01540 [Geminicoccaceae bacterium]